MELTCIADGEPSGDILDALADYLVAAYETRPRVRYVGRYIGKEIKQWLCGQEQPNHESE